MSIKRGEGTRVGLLVGVLLGKGVGLRLRAGVGVGLTVVGFLVVGLTVGVLVTAATVGLFVASLTYSHPARQSVSWSLGLINPLE